jgi:hypothetical protein
MMAPTAPVKIDKRPYVESPDKLEYNLLDVSDENGNSHVLIERNGKFWKLTGTNSNWMAAYYAPAEATE